MPPERGAILELAPFTQWIANNRRLDLDHLGAELTEHFAGERAGDQLAHLDDLEALQRQAVYIRLVHHNTCAGSIHGGRMTERRVTDNYRIAKDGFVECEGL